MHDPEGPYKGRYDEEIVLSLSDWYHEQMPALIGKFLSYTNPTGAEPVPQSALLNESQNVTVKVEPGKTYMLRMVNMAAFAAQYIWFEEHEMQVIEVDGIYTEPMKAEMLYLTAAQRVSVLLTTKNATDKNYAFVGSMDQVGARAQHTGGRKLTVPAAGPLRPSASGAQSKRNGLARLRRQGSQAGCKGDGRIRSDGRLPAGAA